MYVLYVKLNFKKREPKNTYVTHKEIIFFLKSDYYALNIIHS